MAKIKFDEKIKRQRTDKMTCKCQKLARGDENRQKST